MKNHASNSHSKGIIYIVVLASLIGCSRKQHNTQQEPIRAEITPPTRVQMQESLRPPTHTPPPHESRFTALVPPIPQPTMGDVKERKGEIQALIRLFEAGTPDKVKAAIDLMGGGPEMPSQQEERKRQATRVFYADYINAVLQSGDDPEKLQAAQLLTAIVKCAPLNGSAIVTVLLGMLEQAMMTTHDDPIGIITSPDNKKEEWLRSTAVFSRLQPTKKE